MKTEEFSALIYRLNQIIGDPVVLPWSTKIFPVAKTGFYNVFLDVDDLDRAIAKINRILTNGTHHLTTSRASKILLTCFSKIKFQPVSNARMNAPMKPDDERQPICGLLRMYDPKVCVVLNFVAILHVDLINNKMLRAQQGVTFHVSTESSSKVVPLAERSGRDVFIEPLIKRASRDDLVDGLIRWFGLEKVGQMHHAREVDRPILQKECLRELSDHCSGCTKRPPSVPALKRCDTCKVAAYCSRRCQKEHWGTHKKECLDLQGVAQVLSIGI